MRQWQSQTDTVQGERQVIESRRLANDWAPTYVFNDGVLSPDDVEITKHRLTLGGEIIELDTAMPEGWRID